MSIPVFTTKIEGPEFNSKKLKSLGAVIGSDRERISLLRTWGESFMSIFGGRSLLIRKKMDDLIRNAKANLIKNAMTEFPRATAIYDAEFRFESSSFFRNYLDCVITGTAVMDISPKNANNNNTTRKVSDKTKKANKSKTRRSHKI